MIERIRLVNFKNHADTQIELGRLTALIGPNSSGKTNVLRAFGIARQVRTALLAGRKSASASRAAWSDVFVQERSLDFLIRNGQSTFWITLEGASITTNETSETTPWSFSIKIPNDEIWLTSINWEWGGEHGQNMFAVDEGGLSHPEALESQEREWEHVTYLKAIGKNLSAPSYTKNLSPRVESDGSGLASAVAHLKNYMEEHFTNVLKSLQLVVPGVENIRVRPAPVRIKERQVIKVDDEVVQHDKEREVMGHELVFDMAGAQEIPASSVSEGTLLALALLTLLWSPDCPNLVLLDDIEQGLHPKAQRELIGQLRKILEQRPELQIVLTSHSPYIVDELEADEVWLLATDEEGVAQARRLSDHPDAERALEVLTTGEFWSAEGEDWVVADGK